MKVTAEEITKFIRGWTEETMKFHCYKNLDELIEQGYCADVACFLWEYFDRSEELITHDCADPCHTWLEFNGRHYDLQNPEGVSDWRQLDYFKDCPMAILDS